MNDDQFFLANAYLDGELTDAERAIAEADPEVMAEVEELRALQALMRHVDPPSEGARAAAIATAMAEFGVASSHHPPAPAPIPFRPRPSYAKYLAVAAGVLGVGVLGVALANLDTGGDDSMDMAAEPASEEPAEEPAEGRLTEDSDTFPDDVADDAAGDAADEATSEIAAAEEPAAEESASEEPASAPAEEPAEEPADEPAEEPADEPASDDDTIDRPFVTDGQLLTTPEELGSYGTGLLEEQRAGTLGATPNHLCPIENVVGRAEYLVDGAVVPILVAVDEPAGVVSAIADDTCEPVADGPLYSP